MALGLAPRRTWSETAPGGVGLFLQLKELSGEGPDRRLGQNDPGQPEYRAVLVALVLAVDERPLVAELIQIGEQHGSRGHGAFLDRVAHDGHS